MSVVVRPLALSDLADLLAVQLACYGEGFVAVSYTHLTLPTTPYV